MRRAAVALEWLRRLAPGFEQSAPHAPGLGIPQSARNRPDRRRNDVPQTADRRSGGGAHRHRRERRRSRRPRASEARRELTLWHNYGTEGNAVATKNLVAAFEKLHPDISIKVVSQPADNYFALLQSSAISHTSPDLAVMWTGLFDLKYAKFLLNLKPYFSAAETSKLNGIDYMAPDFNLEERLPRDAAREPVLHRLLQQGAVRQGRPERAADDLEPALLGLRRAQGQGHHARWSTAPTRRASAQTFYPFYDFSYAMAGHPLAGAVAGPLLGHDLVDVAQGRRRS